MTDLFIREAHPTDAPLLAQAEREIAKVPGRLASRPYELKDASFENRIKELSEKSTGLYVVAEMEGQVVGHALLDPLKLEVTSHVVDLTIAVHEGNQGKGIGQRLMEHLIEWAQKNKEVEKIELHVRSGNQRAIDMYNKLGFQLEGRKVKRIKLGPNDYLDDISMGMWVGG